MRDSQTQSSPRRVSRDASAYAAAGMSAFQVGASITGARADASIHAAADT